MKELLLLFDRIVGVTVDILNAVRTYLGFFTLFPIFAMIICVLLISGAFGLEDPGLRDDILLGLLILTVLSMLAVVALAYKPTRSEPEVPDDAIRVPEKRMETTTSDDEKIV